MHSILIVDDEPMVREGMQQIINWHEEGYRILGTASNGLEAIRMIEELQPDIVVTDIRMPVVDGIELIKQVKASGIRCEFIILSGYSEFSYAQEAIHQGVSSYLLKPIDEDELLIELKKLSDKINSRKETKQNLALYQQYAKVNRLKEFILYNQYDDTLEIIYSHDVFQLLSFEGDNRVVSFKRLIERINDILQIETIHFTHGNQLIFLLCDITQTEVASLMQQLIADLPTDLIPWGSLISEQTVHFDELPKLYKEIESLRQKRYLFPELRILSTEIINQYRENLENQSNIAKADLSLQLFDAIKQNKHSTIQTYLRMLDDYYKKNDWKEAYIKADLSTLFSHFAEEMEDLINHPLKEDQKRYIMSVILSEQSLQQTFAFLNAIFIDFSRFFDAASDKSNIISEMKEYTRKNFHRNLTLQDISNALNYSYAYLGKKFRAEEKVSYRTYLDSVRIEQAKKMLESQNYLIYEIAEKVGYNNSDYFYKKFKTIVGMSPSDYQKQNES